MFRKPVPRLFIVLACLLLLSCNRGKLPRHKTNWSSDFEQLSKNPFSLYLTYNSLPSLFPSAEQVKLKSAYRMKTLGYELRKTGGSSLIMLIGNRAGFEEGETDSLLSFAEQGHQVLIAANVIDEHLLAQLNLRKSVSFPGEEKPQQHVFLKDRTGQPVSFFCKPRPGLPLQGYFESIDTAGYRFYTLGTNEAQDPDFIVFSVGKGRVFLHATPIVFSNYFLLQQENRRYLELLFGSIQEPVNHVYLCSFNNREATFSDWGVIWRNPATRLALLLALFALGIYILFEMKRRQKIIPIIPPLENSSVAFVETIGRLYYNKKNHTNLAEKMVQHFLDFVRSNYYLNTNNLDQEFVKHLAAKAGKDLATTDTLVYQIREVQSGAKADEAFLYSLYNQIQDFYHGK